MDNNVTDLIIRGCDALQFEDGGVKIHQNQDILVHGNRIQSIQPAGDPLDMSPVESIDAKGLLAIPGLINTHAHVPMVLFRGLVEDVSVEAWFNDYIWPLESNLTPDDVYWGAMLGIAEMIENGITCFSDHYFFMDQVAEAALHSGIRTHLTWAVFGHESETKLDRTCEFATRWQGGGENRITTWLGPHAPYTCSPEFLRLCAKRSKELNTGIHIHVSETSNQVEMSIKEHGISPVQLLADTGILERPCILAHCVYPIESDFEIIRNSSAGIAHAPKTYLKLGMGTAPVIKYKTLGIPVGLATDGAVSSNSLDILEQMRLMALTQKQASSDSTQMKVNQVLEIAFHGSASVVKMGNELGDLSIGKLADIVLLRQDGLSNFPRYDPCSNLVYSTRPSDVDTVICDGKVLMHNRKLLTIDREQVKREITSRLDRLSRKVPGIRIATYPT